MWRDEFLIRDRVTERERAIRDRARVRRLLDAEELTPAHLRPGGSTARRAVARLLAAGGRGALSVAHRLDAGIDASLEGERRAAHG